METKTKIIFVALFSIIFVLSAGASYAEQTVRTEAGSGSGNIDFAAVITGIAQQINQTINNFVGNEPQLQSKISSVPAGTNTSALQTLYTDYTQKLADATRQANLLLSNAPKLTLFTAGTNPQLWILANAFYLTPIQSEIGAIVTDLLGAYGDASNIESQVVRINWPTTIH